MPSYPTSLRGLSPRSVALGTLALAGCTAAVVLVPAPPSADAVPAQQTISCTSGRSGFDFCKKLKFDIHKCRKIVVKNVASGGNKWVKIQIRKNGESGGRFTTGELKPGQSQSGTIGKDGDGRADRFRPRVYVDADSRFHVSVTMRLSFSGC